MDGLNMSYFGYNWNNKTSLPLTAPTWRELKLINMDRNLKIEILHYVSTRITNDYLLQRQTVIIKNKAESMQA